jgi:hypothetical protein
MKPRFLLAGLLAAAFTLMPGPTRAQNRTLVIESFRADVQVQRNGDTDITETIRPRFTGTWNGVFRDLSLQHRTAQNKRARLDVDLVSITDERGEALRFETSTESGNRRWKIWVPGAQDATRTVVIHYIVHNAIRFFDEGNIGPLDELYWNVTGNSWEIPMEQASARITLPDGVVPKQSSGYTGPAGSRESAVTIETSGNVVTFTATRAFAPGEGLTAAVGWEPGVIPRPRPPSALMQGIGEGVPLMLPIVVFLLALGAWRRTGKDPEARAISVQYEPPAQLTPAEVGTLVDHKADMHDITATLVDLAVRGFLQIEKRQEKKLLGLINSTEYVFHLKIPRHEWRGLFEHEQLYLNALFEYADDSKDLRGVMKLFGGGDNEPPDLSGAGAGQTYGSVELSSLKNRFYKDLKGIRKAVYTSLLTKGHYARDPENVKTGWILGGIGLIVASIFVTGWISDSGFLGLNPGLVAGAGVTSGLILLVFSQLMPARTLRGARARETALGFKEFLSKVEEDRFKRMITSPEMFEKYLPYAMAFKVEERWAKAFEDMYTEPPRWYTGYDGGAFRASVFAHDMNALSSVAGSTMASSPSGSGGGGSSGGGSGGGGGGGF